MDDRRALRSARAIRMTPRGRSRPGSTPSSRTISSTTSAPHRRRLLRELGIDGHFARGGAAPQYRDALLADVRRALALLPDTRRVSSSS
jgi:hypothetical protein